jgi:hypothetical protein
MTFSAYKDHPIRALVAQLLDFQGREEFADPVVADNEAAAFARDKVFAIAKLVSGLLEQTPATLASTAALSNLQANLQAPVNELNAYVSNKNIGHITNAASQCEQNVLPLLWGLPQQVASLGESSFSTIVQKQAEASLQTVQLLVQQRDALATSLAEAKAKAEALSLRLDTLQETTIRDRAEAAAAVANLQKAFAEKEIERSAAFEAASLGYKQDYEALRTTVSSKAEGALEDLEEQRKKAARIVQVVGNIGVTGNYQQIANSESTQANFWRWITVAIFGAGISVAAATFIKFWNQPFSTENTWSVVIRLLYAIAITAPAWYTARESARHRTNSDRARQTELELASIGPFIELMPEEKKVEIREALTKSYFGRPVDAHDVQSPMDLGNMKDFVVEIVKAVRK